MLKNAIYAETLKNASYCMSFIWQINKKNAKKGEKSDAFKTEFRAQC